MLRTPTQSLINKIFEQVEMQFLGGVKPPRVSCCKKEKCMHTPMCPESLNGKPFRVRSLFLLVKY